MQPVTASNAPSRAKELLEQSQSRIYARTDRMFAWLMLTQWLAGIGAAVWISPKTWIGATSQVHWHVWAALLLGGAISVWPVFLAFFYSGKALTRHVIAVAQMLMSALLIHLTGGRIETHFHVFGSLAFLAFYRDWRVMITATVVIAADHLVRGLYWPQSVFGVLTASSWRWVEHAGWVLFEDTFLLLSIRQSLREITAVAEKQAGLEAVNTAVETLVNKRTAELLAANSELALREEKFRQLSASAPIGIFETNAAGECLYTNPYWQDITGLTLAESLGQGWRRVIHPDDEAHVAAVWLDSVRTGQPFHMEFRFRRPDDEDRWVQCRSTLLRTEAGAVSGYVGTVEDITERRRDQQRLAASEQRLRSILEAEPECVKLVAPDGRLLDMNPAGLRMIEADSLDQVRGGSCFEIVAEEDRARFRGLHDAVFRGESNIFEFQIIGLKGTRRWMESHACPLRDPDGNIIAHLAVSRDVTARKQAEAELARTQKELVETSRLAGMAEVATGVLHNVGNVLNSVNVASTCVAEGMRKSRLSNLVKLAALLRENESTLGAFLTTDPKGRMIPAYLTQLADHLTASQAAALDELAQLQKNIEHIRDVIAMQQNFAKVSGVIESVNVADLMEDAVRMNISAFARHDVRVVKQYEPVPPVQVEKHKLLQILVNLMRNAKHACEDAGRDDKEITLRIMNSDERVRLSVSDNGVGIPPENLTRIFNHGFTTKKNGHGFGLHSGALAAQEMGGTLKVQSDGVGRGATFVVELPVQPRGKTDV